MERVEAAAFAPALKRQRAGLETGSALGSAAIVVTCVARYKEDAQETRDHVFWNDAEPEMNGLFSRRSAPLSETPKAGQQCSAK